MEAMNMSTAPPYYETLEDLYPDSDAIIDVWYWMVGVAGSIIGCLGITCNVLSLGVLTSREMRTTANLYLTVLAVYDLLFVISSTMFVSIEYFHFGLTGKSDYYYKLANPSLPFADAFLNTSITGSVYTTILLSVDRAIGLSRPLQWPRMCTKRRVKIALTLVLLWAVVLNVPLMIQYRWIEAPPNATGTYYTVESYYAKTFFHEQIYLNVINPIFDSALPLLAIVIANIVIARALHMRHRNSSSIRASSHGSGKTGKDASRITAQVVFISLMTAVTRVLRVMMFVIMEYHDTIHVNFCPLYCGVVAALAHFSNICNATVNFFCFCYFGPKYRACFLKKYGCLKLMEMKTNRQFSLSNGGNSRRTYISGSSTKSCVTKINSVRYSGDGAAKESEEEAAVFTISRA
ncbi:FMRFamide receptor [Plakobranchus ocellatus]|uniref:FMRFamide receptor n=1 Tax=Plakobranchus ocellatus TaxID=259542 RepID=A0AAV3ZK45_9GAST|nr:FMRFamide receptor [Plakobranchus ocellatus]